ncbi:A-kinase anchor protein 9-like isoform X4 [Periplaneta americana]|uniref:A-kinase anchor protein 9-like isoform X4 n=1 Tax=Periplaneta americana TaxID=6978 RepID=UPI0037E7C4B2
MEDEGRHKKVEAGREKLAAYLKKKNASSHQSEQKKKKKVENETEGTREIASPEESLDCSSLTSSIELEISTGNSVTLGGKESFRDSGDSSSERLHMRVRELEEILSGKEAALEAAHEELSALKEISSLDASSGMLDTDYKTHLEEYHKRLVEFQEAVEHREGIIGQLSSSLQQAIQTRDALQLQGDHLAQEVALLQRQLKATTELVQGHQWDTGIKPHDYLTLQNQVLALEATVSKNESIIRNLNSTIKEKEVLLQSKTSELEKKLQELSQHKTKSANEIQKLMREVEELHQKYAVTTSNQSSLILEHEGQLAALRSELEESFGLQLVQIKEELRNRFNEEKQSLMQKHAEEMTACQTLIGQSSRIEVDVASSKNLVESLQHQLQVTSEEKEGLMKQIAELKLSHMSEVTLLNQEIVALKDQHKDNIKTKHIHELAVENTDFEKELETYKHEIENLNFQLQKSSKMEEKYLEQLNENKKVYEAELSACKKAYEIELSSCKEQINTLNLQLQETCKTEAAISLQLTECRKTFEVELAACQQSHEMELASYKQRAEALNLRLQEASEAEENFPKVLAAHRESLESELSKYREESKNLNAKLQQIVSSEDNLKQENAKLIETHKSAVSSYEEELQTLKTSLQSAEEMVKYHQYEVSFLKNQFEESSSAREENERQYKEQISLLSNQLKNALEIEERLKQEINVKDKFESKQDEADSSKCQALDAELTLCKQQIEFLNSRLQDANEAEKCHVSEITACQMQLKEYKDQVESLDGRFNEELIKIQETFSEEINSKDKEIVNLIARIQETTETEKKCETKILSLQQEVEVLNTQLQERVETEHINKQELASYQAKLTAYSDEVQAFKKVASSYDEVQEYKQQVDSLNQNLQHEISILHDSYRTKIKEIEENHTAKITSVSKQVEDLTLQLKEVTTVNDTLQLEKKASHDSHKAEVAVYKQQLIEFEEKFQEYKEKEGKYITDMTSCQEKLISYKNQVELLNSRIKDEVSEMKALHVKEVNDLKDELQHLRNIKTTLEAEVVCLNEAVKNKDEIDESNRMQLEATVQYLKTQSLLAAREEMEHALGRKISDLQADLDKANQCIMFLKNENSHLHEMTVQSLKLESLLAAKDEAEKILIKRVEDLEEVLCSVKSNSKQVSQECTQLTSKVAKAKELLERSKLENEELSEKCRRLEYEKKHIVSGNILIGNTHTDLSSPVQELNGKSSVDGITVASNNLTHSSLLENYTNKITQLEETEVADQDVLIHSDFDNIELVIHEDADQVSESGPLKRRKRDTVNLIKPVSPFCPTKWVERLGALEMEKVELINQLETLQLKYQEKELQERLHNEEVNAAKLHCKTLEEKLLKLEKIKLERDITLQDKSNLEYKIAHLEEENKTFQNLQQALLSELAEERMANEEKLYQLLKERLENLIDEKNSNTVECLILDLGCKSKEIAFLKEKLSSKEEACKLLNKKITTLEQFKEDNSKKINSFFEELGKVRSELEDSWKHHQIIKEELGSTKKELTLLQLKNQQLESSKSRLLQMKASQADIAPVCASSQQEILNMMEELIAEVAALKNSLESEQHRNRMLSLELEVAQNNNGICQGVTDVNSNDSTDGSILELKQKLELILKSNAELVAEKESLLEKLKNQQQYIGTLKMQESGGKDQVESWLSNLDKQQTDLMAELRSYREQHTSLAEIVGSAGVLQETLYRQKQELLRKFEEKAVIEKILENERAELKNAQLRIQMMEHQMLEKDHISQELARQQRLLEQDLHEIEDRLRDQEDKLHTQKLALEAEICNRDLHIRHWQLELRVKQVEMSSDRTLKKMDENAIHPKTEIQIDHQERLELLRSQLEEAHQHSVARLKLHLQEQFAVREADLQKNFSSEVCVLKQQHKEQIMDLQKQLDEKVKEIDVLLNSELQKHLGINQGTLAGLKTEEIIVMKEKQRLELEDMKKNLDEHQTEIYNSLKQKFDMFSEQQIVIAVKLVKDEHEAIHQEIISNLILKYTEELKTLEAKLENEKRKELLFLRQELNKQHKDEMNEATKGLELEISLLKQPYGNTSNRPSVQQLKQEMCMEYTSSLKGLVQTWYSDCQEQLHALNKKIDEERQQEESSHQVEYDTIRRSAVQNNIEELLERKEQLLTQAEVLHNEVAKYHIQALHGLQTQLDIEHSKLLEKVEQIKKTVQEGTTIASLKDQLSKLIAEKEELQNKHKLAVDVLSHEHEVEVTKLRELITDMKCGNFSGLTEIRQELEAKHAKEMEELRQYFEQKCADVEKQYSEEVFSRHSRKFSGSSSGSENEELSDMYYAGGDHGQRLTALTHICDSYTVEPSFKDLEEHYRTDFEKRLVEYRDQLETVKLELEQKYHNEMDLLRQEYEVKVEELVKDLTKTHKAEIENIESKHQKEMQNLKEKLNLDSAKDLNSIRLECAKEVETLKAEMAQAHSAELNGLKDMFEEELKRQVQALTNKLKKEEEEHVATIKSELLNKHVNDIKKLEDSFADHVVDEMGKTSTDTALQKIDLEHKIQTDVKYQYEEEYNKKLAEKVTEMEEKYSKELEIKIETERKIMTEQFDELANVLKNSAEKEQDKFMANQKEMMSNFVKQHQQDLQALKIQHEASLQSVQEESQKLYEDQIQKLKDEHDKNIKALQEEIARQTKERDHCSIQVVDVETYTDISKNDSESQSTTGNAALVTIQQLQDDIKEKDAKFASAILEMKEMHGNELEQLSTHYEGRLHDEVEQAKHDIAKALEEQIQALLSSDLEDTTRPRELIELQEKFTAQYKRELVVLKEEHAKEVERLKEDCGKEIQSISEKYIQNITALKGQIAAQAQEHELEKIKLAMQIKLGDVPDVGMENAVSILNADLDQLIQERDSLKKITATLRYLLKELVTYFTACEDELNNTLIGELFRYEEEMSKDAGELNQQVSYATEGKILKSNDNTETQSSFNIIKNGEIPTESEAKDVQEHDVSVAQDQVSSDNVSVVSHPDLSIAPRDSMYNGTRKVHFAPDMSNIISFIEEDNLLDCVNKNKDLSTDFRSELHNCLERLKAEAVAVLGLSSSLPKNLQITRDAIDLLQEKVNILTKQLEMEVKSKDELLLQLGKIQDKEKDNALFQEKLVNLEIQHETLQSDLRIARNRIAELEHEIGKREDVTEGFGESIQPGLTRRLQNMAQLQDKARTVLSERASDLQKSPHLQLIEELCQEGDRLSEEARKEREDLQQQVSLDSLPFIHRVCCQEVEAADKQLRATRLFLEEQAAEREQERDDFMREIAKLQELVRERDRDRSEHEQLLKEDALEGSEQPISVQTVEALERQIKETTTFHKESDLKKEELETELKAAVDKIWVLRDIIGELEAQVEMKTQNEVTLEEQLRELHVILEQQSRTHQELAEELDSMRLDSGKSELAEHISHLEEQLQKHRLHVEQFQSNSTAVRQMKAQLRDLEAAVDKKTKDLESVHAAVSSASCSSPSEDVSIREQLDACRCDTPEEGRNTLSPVCLPLDELHRLQDKLQRHSRAEEVALKRILDLEMQLKGVKKNEEEVVAERDVLQERMEEQLLKISALQSRLDEQRRKPDSVLKEANFELQTKVRDQEMDINKLRETVDSKDQEVNELKSSLEEARKIIAAQEKEWSTKISEDTETIEKLKQTCQMLKMEKNSLLERVVNERMGNDIPIILKRKRSEGRMKTFSSVTDRRAWSLDPEERRKYFLEVIKGSPPWGSIISGGPDGQYVPINIILDILMNGSNAFIAHLQKQLRHLNEIIDYMSQFLDPDKRIELEEMRNNLQDHTSGARDELRHYRQDESARIFSTDKDNVLYTSDRAVMSSDSEGDFHDSTLKSLLIEKDSEILALKNELAALQQDCDEKDLYLKEAMRKLKYVNEILSINKNLKDELAEVNTKFQTQQKVQERMKRGLSELRTELDKKDEKLLEYEGLLADKSAFEAEIENLKKTIKAVEKDNKQCHEKLDSLRTSEAQARMEVEDTLMKLQEKKNEIELLHSYVAEKEEVIKEMSIDRQSTIAKLDKFQKYESELMELQSDKDTLKKEIELLKEKLSECAAENNELKEELGKLPGTPDELAGQVKKELDMLTQMDIHIMEQMIPEGGVSDDGICTCTLPSPGFSQILNKILRDGIGSLTFSELSFLHHQTCKATSAMNMQDSTSQTGLDIKTIAQMPPCRTYEDKQQMSKQMNALESEIVRKQQEAQKKIDGLQADIRHQSRSIADLEVERQRLEKKSSYQDDRMRQFIVMLDEERTKARQLEDDLLKEKTSIKHLHSLLESERQYARLAKLKDSDLIENMRISLEHALDNEAKAKLQLEQEKRAKETAESQLGIVPQLEANTQQMYNCTRATCPTYQTPSSYKAKLDLEHEKLAKLQLDLQRERRRAEELEAAVEKERQLGIQRLEIEKEIIQDLKREFVGLEGQRDSLNSQLTHVREQLSLRNVEVEALERRIRMLQEAEFRRQRKRIIEQEEMDKNRLSLQKAQAVQFDLEQKIVALEQEITNLNQQLQEYRENEGENMIIAAGLNHNTAELKQEVEELKQNLEDSRMREQLLASSSKESSPVLEKLKNVNIMLEQHMTENAEVALTLSRLTEERQHLHARIRELEQMQSLSKQQTIDETDSAQLAFAAERAIWAQEKAALKLALAQAEADVIHCHRIGDPGDVDDKVKNLLGKYLRAESYRKALVWQKRYLLVVLGGYQESEAITVSRLAHLSGVQEAMLHQQHTASRKKPKTRFRTAAIVVIAVSRMHYLVRRWRQGRRIGSNAALSRGYSESALSSTQSSYHGPRRRDSSTSLNSLGVPRMSSQGCSTLSPPSRDRPMLRRWETDIMHMRSSESIPVPSLGSNHVAEFVDRFDQLQRRLGLGITRPPP